MEWQPGGLSSDIEDRRNDSGGGGGGGFGFGGGGLGIGGFILLLVISLVTGHNFLGGLFGGGSNSAPQTQVQQGTPDAQNAEGSAGQTTTAGNDRDAQLISFVNTDVQKFWRQTLTAEGKPYHEAHIVLYRGETDAGCGEAQAATGPFYCPEDQKVYIDLSFWDELRKFGGSTADFAQAFVLSHELGHHVQNMLGTEPKVQHLMETEPSERNHLSVDLELQADCYGGVWAHHAQAEHILDPGDIPAALSAVAAVGDDHLEKMSGRAVSPESWTHGSSQQRQSWFERGFQSGDPANCNTFGSNGQ
ncbi:MAG: KPN_02809 family neutral zinc metallopeptidase [Janthinobacterium lividum]